MNCGPMSELVTDVTEDLFLGGRLRLRQPRSGHRSGHDAMLLAAATAVRPGDRVVEFGAGIGAAGLALARRAGAITLTLVEIEPRLAALARDNADANDIKADVVVLDVTAPPDAFAGFGPGPDSADVVLMNPPFNDAARHRVSPDRRRASAHVAGTGTLDGWIRAGHRLLKSGGALTLIWRADGLAEVLAALGRGFGSDPDLARRWPCGGAGGARARLRQPCDPSGARRSGKAGNPRPGSRRQGRQGADTRPCGPDAQ
jgi:tRNA1(Val) A37 N6-methylase TrmN6